MALPNPPDWKELAANPAWLESWTDRQFVASDIPGFVICLKCASLVVFDEQVRHDNSLHGFKGF